MQEKKHDAVNPSDSEAPGYWYNSMDGRHIGVLNLLRDYREAERSMRARTRDEMRMNETELLALRFLLMRTQQQHEVLQRDIARELGITGASASALCQRLERDGYINRFPTHTISELRFWYPQRRQIVKCVEPSPACTA